MKFLPFIISNCIQTGIERNLVFTLASVIACPTTLIVKALLSFIHLVVIGAQLSKSRCWWQKSALFCRVWIPPREPIGTVYSLKHAITNYIAWHTRQHSMSLNTIATLIFAVVIRSRVSIVETWVTSHHSWRAVSSCNFLIIRLLEDSFEVNWMPRSHIFHVNRF